MTSTSGPRPPIESGVPDSFLYMHPLLKKNYGQWDWHDNPRPGVLHHVAKNGDEVWTVRAGTPRQLDVYAIRNLCDIGDNYAEGHVRFTSRSNIEYMVSSASKVEPLITALHSEQAKMQPLQSYTPPSTPPNYDDVKREEEDRTQRIKEYQYELDRLYARYRELEDQKKPLLDELSALAQQRSQGQ